MIVVADNLRSTLPAVGRAVERLDPEPIRQMVSACIDAGAQAIDINSGPLSRTPEEQITFRVRAVPKTVDLAAVLKAMKRDGTLDRLAEEAKRSIKPAADLKLEMTAAETGSSNGYRPHLKPD